MRFINKKGIRIRRQGRYEIHGVRGMCNWTGGEIEWKIKNLYKRRSLLV
jgi:hypothetical protein